HLCREGGTILKPFYSRTANSRNFLRLVVRAFTEFQFAHDKILRIVNVNVLIVVVPAVTTEARVVLAFLPPTISSGQPGRIVEPRRIRVAINVARLAFRTSHRVQASGNIVGTDDVIAGIGDVQPKLTI